jgi:membrane protease YdiL (CAAX protease family)
LNWQLLTSMFGRMSDIVKACLFCAIAFVLCVGATKLTPALGAHALKVAMMAPLAAVLIMLLVVTRDGFSRDVWLGLGLHRAGISGWPLALFVPLTVLGFAFGTVWLSGMASFAVSSNIGDVSLYALDILASIVIVALIGGIGEEIGWRGYLLPRLMSLGIYPALLLSGFAHGLFHLPAILWTPYYHSDGDPFVVIPLFLATLTVAGVCYGYLRLTTGSVWPAAIAHSAFNIFWDRLNGFTQTRSPLTLEYLAGESGVLTFAALTVVALWLASRLPRAGVAYRIKDESQ